MAELSLGALEDKIRISALCRLMMKKGLLTYEEFEELATRSYVIDRIETMPAEEFKKKVWQIFEICDPDNKTGWKERDNRKKGAK